ncbi:Dimethyl-sulfide monooxygenase [Variovorax sp. PBS-H4]|uniref:NtaA/DmoA family FMN-dependent monooxygenase n=1 Tax=Variovorax sp. PBS-H4 TaxID=434008 RepID=UPI00131711A6|nr:NtaA/DmoA family FMN-dependent monooxygenase [Variovorax sp. PBS-H4]VTU27275.1 Dimethyl-sulfide monooxygenase [Variovorax sp. PBS-H4]
MNRHILVNAFSCASPAHTWSGLWTHPDSSGPRYNTLAYWTEMARTCEEGLLDGVFIADALGVPDVFEGKPDAMLRSGSFCPSLDPMMLVPAMAAVTKHLGFGITGNTTYEMPYLLARRFSTLDHLTNGRIAWNVVSGVLDATARGVGLKQMAPHDERYAVADEYMDLVYGLWEGSWGDRAIVRDRVNKVYADPVHVRPVHHEGKYFRCDAIHMSEPSPQRTPLVFSAGASPAGLDFVGKHSECAFVAFGKRDFVRKQVQGIRERLVAHGRDPRDARVFVPATIIVGRTDAEAEEIVAECRRYSSIEGNLAGRATATGIDYSKYPLDQPVPNAKTNAGQGVSAGLTNAEKPLTLRDLGQFGPGRDLFLAGSASSVADQLVAWCEDTGVEGLNITRALEPLVLKNFCRLLVPELQARGAFKTSYAEGTLREKLFPGHGGRLAAPHPAVRHRQPA